MHFAMPSDAVMSVLSGASRTASCLERALEKPATQGLTDKILALCDTAALLHVTVEFLLGSIGLC